MQEALLARLARTVGQDPFGAPVRVVTPPAAALQWEREILRRLGGGSLRLRVETPGRLAASLLAAAGQPLGSLSRAQLRAAVRIVTERQGTLQAFGAGAVGREGAPSLLAETLEAAWWQVPRLPETARGALGSGIFDALRAAQDGVVQMAGKAGLAPEPWLLWRAAEIAAQAPWPPGTIFWPLAVWRPAEAALRDRLREAGLVADLPAEEVPAPRPDVTVEVRSAPDMRLEARRAARRCQELVRAGAMPRDILVGCGDFPLQQGLLRSALTEAGLAVDAGPEPVQGEPLVLCLAGLLDMARGRAREGLLSLASSGAVPGPGPLRDSLLRHLRDGGDATEDLRGWLAAIEAELERWPRRAPFEEHRERLSSLLALGGLPERLGDPSLDRQGAILRSLEDQFDAISLLAGDAPVARPLALRLMADAVAASRCDYQPKEDAVRVVPLADMQGLEAEHVLLLGLAEGRFPQLAAGSGILQAAQLQHLESVGTPVAEPLGQRRQRGLGEVAAALGAARRSLYASYAEIDGQGGVQAAAIRLRLLGEPQPFPSDLCETAFSALTRQEAGEIVAQAAGRLRDIGGGDALPRALLAAYEEACGAGPYRSGLEPARVEPKLRPLPGPFAVTALERRAACPFTSFAHDLLHVEPGRRDGFDPAARGALVHQVLRDLPLDAPPAAEQEETVSRLVAGAAQSLGVLPPDTPAGQALGQELAGEVLRTARLVWEEARRSAFRPSGREVAFGSRGQLPPLAVGGREADDLLIEGRIDRLDRLGGRLRVVDYKVRRRHAFSFARVYHGLDLQVGAYALAAAHGGGETVVMAYWPVRLGQAWVVEEGDDDPEAAWRAQRPQGLFLADPALIRDLDREAPDGGSPFHPLRRKKNGDLHASPWALSPGRWQALLRHMERRLKALAAEAQAGDWAPSPFSLGRQTACDGCAMRPACRHVPRRDGFRRLERVTQEVLDNVPADD